MKSLLSKSSRYPTQTKETVNQRHRKQGGVQNGQEKLGSAVTYSCPLVSSCLFCNVIFRILIGHLVFFFLTQTVAFNMIA